MAFDFPNAPTLAQVVSGPNGLQYIWDGTKWIPGTTPNNLAPINAPTFTGDPKAPTPVPGDNDTSIATTAFVQNAVSGISPTVLNNTGRNYLNNSMFRIWQHGTGSFTASGYTADQWKLGLSLDACTTSYLAATDADRAGIGDEEVNVVLNVAVTGNAGAAAFTVINQPVENVSRLSNKQVTISFWAKASAGTPKIGISFDQIFGTGGSPSASVAGNGTAVTLSTSWARYSTTVTLPSIAGKTVGTNSDHYTTVILWFSSGATNNTRAGGIGVQTATFQIWGIQLELGSTPSALSKIPYSDDLARCQRYCQTGSFGVGAYGVTGVGTYSFHAFAVTMRAAPTITSTPVTQVNCTGSISSANVNGMTPQAVASGNGGLAYQGTFTASAEL